MNPIEMILKNLLSPKLLPYFIFIIIAIIIIAILKGLTEKYKYKKYNNYYENSYENNNHENFKIGLDAFLENKIISKKESLLSPPELAFYKTIKTITEGQYTIFSKVRLEDIFEINEQLNISEKIQFRNFIRGMHLDFIICENDSLKIVYAIEIDDKSHYNKKAKLNDEKKNKVLETIEIPLVRINAKNSYSQEEILSRIFNVEDNSKYMPK